MSSLFNGSVVSLIAPLFWGSSHSAGWLLQLSASLLANASSAVTVFAVSVRSPFLLSTWTPRSPCRVSSVSIVDLSLTVRAHPLAGRCSWVHRSASSSKTRSFCTRLYHLEWSEECCRARWCCVSLALKTGSLALCVFVLLAALSHNDGRANHLFHKSDPGNLVAGTNVEVVLSRAHHLLCQGSPR